MTKRPSMADNDQPVTDSADGDPFLSRWARRKAVVRSGGDPDTVAGDDAGDGKSQTAPPAASGEAPATAEDAQSRELTDADMPPLETIDESTDMSGFLSPKVSEAVKKVALRKFFRSPIFNIVDGLDDYDDDFRNFEALGDIITSDMRGQMEREAERAREEAAEKSATPDAVKAEAQPSDDASAQEVADADTGDEDDQAPAADEQAPSADDAGAPEQLADADGVTREPGLQTRGGGKLRPKGTTGDDQ